LHPQMQVGIPGDGVLADQMIGVNMIDGVEREDVLPSSNSLIE